MSMSPYGVYSGLFKNAGNLANWGGMSGLGSTFGDIGNSFGVLGGLQQGGVGGYGKAAINSGSLLSKTGALGNYNSALNRGIGDASNLLGIYGGIRAGGVGGYGGAAVNAGQLATRNDLLGGTGGNLGQALGYAAIPLDLWNEAKNWQSGNVGSDAMGGATTGAAIGTEIAPGIGTAIGALGGALVGGLSSLAGPGKIDPETKGVQSLIDAVGKSDLANPGVGTGQTIASQVNDPYIALAGLMDRKSSTLPMYQQYGRMGEQKFTNDLVNQIQGAEKSGQITPVSGGGVKVKNPDGSYTTYNGALGSQYVYNNVVDPWVEKMGSGYNNVGEAYTDTTKGLLQDMTSQYMNGTAPQNWKAIGGDTPFANLPSFTGATPTTQATPQQIRVNPMTPGVMTRAGGGSMRKKSALQTLVPHYDDGGGVDWSMFSDPSLQTVDTPTNIGTDVYGSDPTTVDSIVNQGNDPLAYGISIPSSSGGSGGSSNPTQTGLAAFLGASGPLGQYGKYAALLPLLGSLTGLTNPKQPSAPGQPAGFSSGSPQLYSPSSAMTVRTPNQMNPNTDWYTYGQHPEQSFFSNNQLPYIPGYSPTSAAPGAQSPFQITNQGPVAMFQAQPVQPSVASRAQGGALSQMFDSGSGDTYVQGPGDGTSDDIPAKLSDGEYVVDAGTVSMLGNGSNKAGAQALDQLRQRVRKHAGKRMVKGRQFMKAKPPEQYLRGAGGEEAA